MKRTLKNLHAFANDSVIHVQQKHDFAQNTRHVATVPLIRIHVYLDPCVGLVNSALTERGVRGFYIVFFLALRTHGKQIDQHRSPNLTCFLVAETRPQAINDLLPWTDRL